MPSGPKATRCLASRKRRETRSLLSSAALERALVLHRAGRGPRAHREARRRRGQCGETPACPIVFALGWKVRALVAVRRNGSVREANSGGARATKLRPRAHLGAARGLSARAAHARLLPRQGSGIAHHHEPHATSVDPGAGALGGRAGRADLGLDARGSVAGGVASRFTVAGRVGHAGRRVSAGRRDRCVFGVDGGHPTARPPECHEGRRQQAKRSCSISHDLD